MTRRYNADVLTELVRGFQAACVLVAAAELDVFTSLNKQPADGAAMAGRIKGDPRATTVLLDALASMDLLLKRKGVYSVSPDVAEMLTENGGRSILGTVRHQGNCLRRWSQLAKVVLTGQAVRDETSVRGTAGDTASFIQAMHEISSRFAPDLIKSIGLIKFNHLLDLGGASGTWTIPLLQLNPDAKATIFDLPAVMTLAEERVKSSGMADRIRLVAGDFNADELPKGADFVWVSAIVHQNSRAENRALFSKIFAALVPGGTVLIRDIVMEESRTSPPAGAFFAVNMLVGTPGGGTYTFRELQEDLASAGLAEVKLLRKGERMDSLVRAIKPKL